MRVLSIFSPRLLVLWCLCVVSCTNPIFTQDLDDWETTFSIKAETGFSLRSKTYISISFAVGFKRLIFNSPKNEQFFKSLNKNSFIGFQSGVNIYYNGLGDNILDKFKRVNLDLVTSFFATGGMSTNNSLIRNDIRIRPFHSLLASAIEDNYHHSFTLGTNVVLNVHNRNQIVGFFNLNIARLFTMGYYNDGTPFGQIGLGDRFDRWWTGGGFAEVYLNQGYSSNYKRSIVNSKFAFFFDRFTGDVQDAYSLSGTFGFQYVPSKNTKESYYNRAKGKFAFTVIDEGYEFSYQKIGYLKNDIQDVIHRKMGMPYHITYAKQYSIIGLSSDYNFRFKL